ncbi:KinB-signaling pathway activation protein [Alicyclobacillus pomorum]|jgi:KinB signaling pathway activation protein|uniref:KinB-signaling pathway activation protein n=1 Tax=Alicyclobacillus pomorum TaxID=204470 RepID=UPI000429C767|nr:KinB-signaling pathway activation protein [Alicyclobacillus pomorum]
MRLNQFIFLLASTVMVGALAGVVTSILGLWMHLPWYAGLVSGAFFSTTSLMGFWAYLTLNFVARVTLPRRVWRWAQVVFLLMAIYDMLWWRYHLNATVHAEHAAFRTYFFQGFWPLVAAVIGAYLKRRMSGSASFLPALFFLYVFTVIDSLPFIWLQYGWAQSGPLVNQILIVMTVCNLYITLIYGKLLTPGNQMQVKAANKPSL